MCRLLIEGKVRVRLPDVDPGTEAGGGDTTVTETEMVRGAAKTWRKKRLLFCAVDLQICF